MLTSENPFLWLNSFNNERDQALGNAETKRQNT